MMTFVSDGRESTDRMLASFPFDRGVITDEVALAFALARENHMPIIVFSIRDAGAVTAVLRGEGRATTVG